MLLGFRLGWTWAWWPFSHQSDSFQSGPFQEGCCCEILWRAREELFISARYSQLPGCCQGNGRSCFLGWPGRGACSRRCSPSSSCDLEKAEVSSVVQSGKRVTSTLARFLVSGGQAYGGSWRTTNLYRKFNSAYLLAVSSSLRMCQMCQNLDS